MGCASDSTVVELFLGKNMFLPTTLCVEETLFHVIYIYIFEVFPLYFIFVVVFTVVFNT